MNLHGVREALEKLTPEERALATTRFVAENIRAVSIDPKSWNPETRTMDVCFSTGRRCMKYDWMTGRAYIEDLPLDGMDLTDLNLGAHVLRSHGRDMATYGSLDGVLGSVVPGTAHIRQGAQGLEAWATIKLSDEASDREIVNKMVAGIIRQLSYGYEKIGDPTISKDPETGLECRTWARHRPYEISPVPIAADPGAGTRALQGGIDMSKRFAPDGTGGGSTAAEPQDGTRDKAPGPDGTRTAEPPVATAAPVAPDLDAVREAARKEERQRADQIRAYGERMKIPGNLVNDLIASGKSWDDSRIAILETAAERANNLHIDGFQSVQMGADERDKKDAAYIDGLCCRASPKLFLITEKSAPGSRDFVGTRASIILADLYQRHTGRDVRHMDPGALCEMIFSARDSGGSAAAGDFSNLTSAVANKHLQRGYNREKRTFDAFFAPRTAPDFKDNLEVQWGTGMKLQAVGENGEIKYGKMTEGAARWNVSSFAVRSGFSRKLIINDDLSAISRVPAMAGQRVITLENDMAWALITGNALAPDGKNLFHADHGNVIATSGAKPTVDEIGRGRALMRLQKYIDGAQLNLTPTIIATSSALETYVNRLTSGVVVATKTLDVVPEPMRSLRHIVEPRLDAADPDAWYLFADPMDYETFVFGLLAGYEAPRISTRPGWDIQGIEIKIEHDCGVGTIDHRGAFKDCGK